LEKDAVKHILKFFSVKHVRAFLLLDLCLNSSVWLDGAQVMDEGKLIPRELAKLAQELGKQ